jgi:hypothetical protein
MTDYLKAGERRAEVGQEGRSARTLLTGGVTAARDEGRSHAQAADSAILLPRVFHSRSGMEGVGFWQHIGNMPTLGQIDTLQLYRYIVKEPRIRGRLPELPQRLLPSRCLAAVCGIHGSVNMCRP